MRAIPERLIDASCEGATEIDYLYSFFFIFNVKTHSCRFEGKRFYLQKSV